MDEASRAPLHKTSHLPYQGMTQLLLQPFNMAKPPFSPEWCENGHDSPLTNGYDGRIPGVWSSRVDRHVEPGQESSSLGA